jgi:hypothetical protein
VTAARANTAKAVKRRAESALSAFGFTGPVSIATLKSALEAERGRPIVIETAERELFTDTACGLWWECDAFDLIFVPEDADPLLRDHTIFHEFGHMIFRHRGEAECADSGALAMRSFLAKTMPDLNVDKVVGSLHQRTDYGGHAEREAEVLASLLSLRADADARRLANGEADTLRRALGGE